MLDAVASAFCLLDILECGPTRYLFDFSQQQDIGEDCFNGSKRRRRWQPLLGGALLAPRQQGGATSHSLTGCGEHFKTLKNNIQHCFVSLLLLHNAGLSVTLFRRTSIFESVRGDSHWTISVQFFKQLCFLCCFAFLVAKSFTSTKPRVFFPVGKLPYLSLSIISVSHRACRSPSALVCL